MGAHSRGQGPKCPISLEDVTDWYISAEDSTDGGSSILVYPGAFEAKGELEEHGKKLREIALWRQGQELDELRDWRIEYRGIAYRAHRQRTVEGSMYILRKLKTGLPNVAQLGLPSDVLNMLLHQRFGESGGLVLITGGPGHGKSTTTAAVVIKRVLRFGSFCLTVEDPPEFPLHGDHPADNGCIGKVVQVPAHPGSFAVDLKDALRCYPSNMMGSMLMVGEVRDGDTAAQLLRAAVNGQLVFATMHASDPIAALERLLALGRESMGADEAKSLLAYSLRMVLHQTLARDVLSGGIRLQADVLVSAGPTSSVAGRISSEASNLRMLASEMERQRTLLSQGRLFEHASAEGILRVGRVGIGGIR